MKKNKCKGFTTIELIIVVAVIVALAAALISVIVINAKRQETPQEGETTGVPGPDTEPPVHVCSAEALKHCDGKSATCAEAGWEEYWLCGCGKLYSDAEGKKEIEKIVLINATGAHTYGAWAESKKASCETDGERTRACTVCGQSESEVIEKNGHDYSVLHKDASGHWYGCSRCDSVTAVEAHLDSAAAYSKESGKYYKTCPTCGHKSETASLRNTQKEAMDLNELLAENTVKNATMYDALKYISDKKSCNISDVINEIKNAERGTNSQIVWDQTLDRFVTVSFCTGENELLDGYKVIYTPDSNYWAFNYNGTYNEEYVLTLGSAYTLWDTYKIDDIPVDANEKEWQWFSIYVEGTEEFSIADYARFTSGLDLGENTCENGCKITFRCPSSSADNAPRILRTVGNVEITVECTLLNADAYAPVYHYGSAAKLSLTGKVEYSEFGSVTTVEKDSNAKLAK